MIIIGVFKFITFSCVYFWNYPVDFLEKEEKNF